MNNNYQNCQNKHRIPQSQQQRATQKSNRTDTNKHKIENRDMNSNSAKLQGNIFRSPKPNFNKIKTEKKGLCQVRWPKKEELKGYVPWQQQQIPTRTRNNQKQWQPIVTWEFWKDGARPQKYHRRAYNNHQVSLKFPVFNLQASQLSFLEICRVEFWMELFFMRFPILFLWFTECLHGHPGYPPACLSIAMRKAQPLSFDCHRATATPYTELEDKKPKIKTSTHTSKSSQTLKTSLYPDLPVREPQSCLQRGITW